MHINYFLILSLFMSSLWAMENDDYSSKRDLDFSKKNIKTMLPVKIIDLVSLNYYALFYNIYTDNLDNNIKYFSNKNLKHEKAILPHLHFQNQDASFTRVREIMLIDPKKIDTPSDDGMMEPAYIYWFPLGISDDDEYSKQKMVIENNFASFLLKNNEELLPNYKRVLLALLANIDDEINLLNEFMQNVTISSLTVLQKWLKSPRVSELDKKHILTKCHNLIADYYRLKSLHQFIQKNIDSLQLLDVYFLAEQSFHLLNISNTVIKQIIDRGKLFDSFLYNIDTSEKIYDDIRFDINNLLRNKEFPLRRYYLFTRAMAFSLRDFANNFRAQAQLPAIPDDLFTQDDSIKNALAIDFSLPLLAELVSKEWTSDSLSHNIKPISHPPIKSIKLAPLKSYPLPAKNKRERSLIDKKTNDILVVKTKLSLPEKIYAILNEKDRDIWLQLCALNNNLTAAAIERLNLAIYSALIQLNKAFKAAWLIKRSADSRIFSKNISEQEGKEYRLLPYALQGLIHPDIDLNDILSKSPFLAKRVYEDKLKLFKDDIDIVSKNKLEHFLKEAENIARAVEDNNHKQILLINLAHAWHKLAIALERVKNINDKQLSLATYKDKIISLLKDAYAYINDNKLNVTVLEAYLYSYYLNYDIKPHYYKLTAKDINAIKQGAKATLQNTKDIKPIFVPVITPSGKKIGEYSVYHSIFHAITNSKLGDYVIIKFTKPTAERKIPLYVEYEGVVYRTDIFGGSRLKPNPKEGDYGSLIGVSLQAADFFEQQWFLSEESFWYASRAFMPEEADQEVKSSRGKIKIITVPDKDKEEIFLGLMVQDGVGFIKESIASTLKLSDVDRKNAHNKVKALAFQALQAYEPNKNVALEMLNHAIKHQDPKDPIAPSYTMPKKTFIGIAAKEGIILPDDDMWREYASDGLMIGRNPYSAKRIQVIDDKDIKFSKELSHIKVFQYTMTGYLENANKPKKRNKSYQSSLTASFFKGLLVVVPDDKWPQKYHDISIIVSAKDQKLNGKWLSEDYKKKDQSSRNKYNFYTTLVVKQEYNKQFVGALNKEIADALAGDFDGDPYDIMPTKGFSLLASLIKAGQNDAIPNPKIDKSYTLRSKSGNFHKILGLRKPILPLWNVIVNRYYYLMPSEREKLASMLANDHRLREWLGETWSDQLKDDIKRELRLSDIIIAEMQLGVKLGEDAYKTKVDIDLILQRAKEYDKALNIINPQSKIPYNHKSTLDYEKALGKLHSSNLVHKAFRALSRWRDDANHDQGNEEQYLSDDE